MSPAWRQQCSAMERVCANEYEWELFRTTEYCNTDLLLWKKLLCFFLHYSLFSEFDLQVLYVNVKNTVNLPSCQKTSGETAGANQCAQIFELDFESVSYLRITFPRKYQTLSKIGKLKSQIANRNRPLICSWMQIEWQFARKLGLSKFKIAFRAKLRTSASRIKFYEKANLNNKTPKN